MTETYYTVIYTYGVDDEEVFSDQIYTVEEGAPIPNFKFNGVSDIPQRDGYIFDNWSSMTTENGDIIYVTQWKAN